MGLLRVITWPARTLVAVIKYLINLCIAVILFPFRLIASILKWIVQILEIRIQRIKTGVQSLRLRKPFSYLFPLTPAVTTDNNDPLTTPLSNEEYESRNSAFSHGSIRHRHNQPTSQCTVPPRSESNDETQSIASLIQDLIKLSQPDSDKDEKKDEPNQKVLQLPHDISTNEEGDTGNDDSVSTMLDDLGAMESYLSQFVYEQSRTDSLETIIEESTSKESSPSTAGSPAPRVCSIPPPGDTIIEEDEELTVSQNEISQTLLLLQKLTKSEELKTELRETANVHRPSHDDFETPPTSMSSSQEFSPENPSKNRAAVKQSLQEQQEQFIKTQQQLQNVMDSLNVHTLDQATPFTNPAPPEATPLDPSNEIYDSLADPIPVYSRLEKKPRPPDELPLDEQIYDSVEPMSKQEQPSPMAKSETPPPIPIRRTYSGGSTTDSGDNSPNAERRLHRRHSHHGGDGDHRRRHRRRHHHCRHCDDYSPDRCSHHRPRSRERHHRHHRHRSNSDESRESTHRYTRGYHESSGYESHPHEQELESPVPPRRKQRTNSDASSTGTPSVPPTPKEGRRGFLGFFTKKSTSLTSLESTKSESGEKESVQSYKM